MKKYFSALIIFISLSSASAQDLALKSIKDLVTEIEASTFTYKEKGLAFGYFSIHSCLYVSGDMAILKNYCFPKRNYAARGFTIISAKYGMIDIYQEKIDAFIKRDFTQVEFKEYLAPYLGPRFPRGSLSDLNAAMESVYNEFNPGCWSTNRSSYTQAAEANCTVSPVTVGGFDAWALETQAINGNEVLWNELFMTIEKKLSPNN